VGSGAAKKPPPDAQTLPGNSQGRAEAAGCPTSVPSRDTDVSVTCLCLKQVVVALTGVDSVGEDTHLLST